MQDNNQVTILIPTMLNSRFIIELCLETIRKYTTYPCKIIVGNGGVDDETEKFLKNQKDISFVDLPKDIAAKDSLARLVDTEYYLFLHDDTQILKNRWLERRIDAMRKNDKNAVVGMVTHNYCYDWRSRFLFLLRNTSLRFFPLGMLVKTSAAKELGLEWGIVKGKFDTGGDAYQQFFSQRKYKFVKFPFKSDIRHFGEMSWPVKKKINNEKTSLDLDKLIAVRNNKIESIKSILREKNF